MDSVAIITNNPVSIRSRDAHRQFNSYLHYLTGWHGEDGVAVFFYEGTWKCRLYVQARDVVKETWTGRRPGTEGALENWPIDEAESRDMIRESLEKMLVDCNSVYHIEGLDSVVDDIVSKTFDDILTRVQFLMTCA